MLEVQKYSQVELASSMQRAFLHHPCFQRGAGPSKTAVFVRNEDAGVLTHTHIYVHSVFLILCLGCCHGKPLTPIVVSLIFILAFAGRR